MKLYIMYRVDIFSFLASDAGELTKMQTRLNQWITAGTLKKYDIHTAGDYIIFNVARLKDQ
jgi:hypothetical protein